MVKYLEAAECICLAISVCNLIAVSFAMKKQKPINKIMYFVNNLGIVVLSNLIVWTEGCYVDENNCKETLRMSKKEKSEKNRKKLRNPENMGFSTFLFLKIDILGVAKK